MYTLKLTKIQLEMLRRMTRAWCDNQADYMTELAETARTGEDEDERRALFSQVITADAEHDDGEELFDMLVDTFNHRPLLTRFFTWILDKIPHDPSRGPGHLLTRLHHVIGD